MTTATSQLSQQISALFPNSETKLPHLSEPNSESLVVTINGNVLGVAAYIPSGGYYTWAGKGDNGDLRCGRGQTLAEAVNAQVPATSVIAQNLRKLFTN